MTPHSTMSLRSRTLVVALAVMALIAPIVAVAATPASAGTGGSIQYIDFEPVNESHVVLGDLASRSQRKPIDISGLGPYEIRGTDSRTGDPYTYFTDSNYDPATRTAWGRESDERALSGTGSWTSSTTASWDGRTDVLMLKQSSNCLTGNTFDGLETYCSVFGPDVYTETFTAEAGQAVSFDWSARNITDDYEIYAFLVKVEAGGYGTETDHTLLAHGRGEAQAWTTTSREVPSDGTYRFRFVNGSYDATGGYALGSEMYIDSVLRLGTANPITFDSLGDKIVGAAPFEVSATAPGGPVEFSSATPGICTVTGSEVTLTDTPGTCTIVADQEGDGTDYVPAESVSQSFRVLAAATSPTNAGAPYITGTMAEGEVLTVHEGTWTDGGEPITSTDFQWQVRNGTTTTDLSGETGTQCLLIASDGSELRAEVTKTNSVGSTSATTTYQLAGFTCGDPVPPVIAADGLGDMDIDTPFTFTVAATGVPAATYSISGGALPDGLTLDSTTGEISGTPTAAGAFEFTVRASNMGGDDTRTYSGEVRQAPSDMSPSSDSFSWRVGDTPTIQLTASGTPSPTFAVMTGSLPPGMSLDSTTGLISGTPDTEGDYIFTVSADNGVGDPLLMEFTVEVLASAGGVLATTGISMGVWALIAAVLVLLGLATIGWSLQRRTA